jgi:hypothetical protein
MKHTHCQSCDRPIVKPVDRGTNENGTLSDTYCGHCFSMGYFREPELTLAEMEAKVAERHQDMGWPGFLARLLARRVRKLERWAGRQVQG